MRAVDFLEIESLQRMAWSAHVSRSTKCVEVTHGPWVETFADAFVEGAWSGAFDELEFGNASIQLGSGGSNLRTSPVFSTASHPFEPLYSTHVGDGLHVSNSLALLCRIAGIGAKVKYPHYFRDLTSFTRGLTSAERAIPIESGHSVRLHYCSHISVLPDLRLEEERRDPLPPIENFDHYRSFVTDAASTIARNASHPERKNHFRPLATVSSGYDSPAAAVFAKEAGATRAVTFGSGRSVFGSDPDSGKEVARHLDLDIVEFNRLEYREREDFPEVEFLATGTGGEDVVFASFEEELPGCILFTGFLGDTLWSRYHPDPTRSLEYSMTYPAGASLSEFRLRVGFVHFPVPLTTFTQHPSLHRISNSPEMEPWSVSDSADISLASILGHRGPGYDRPIARRIVEEAGVPKHVFGQAKRAVSQPFYNDDKLDGIMAPDSLRDFRSFLAEAGVPPKDVDALLRWVASTTYRILRVPFQLIRKFMLFLRRPVGIDLPWPDHYKDPPTENQYTFHWALERVKRRYGTRLPPAKGKRCSER